MSDTATATLRFVQRGLSRLAVANGLSCRLVIKLHPREEHLASSTVLGLLEEVPAVDTVVAGSGVDRHELVSAADVVLGMTSMLLYEASLLGCHVISVQLSRDLATDLTELHDGITAVRDEVGLEAALADTLTPGSPSDAPVNERAATERWIENIRARIREVRNASAESTDDRSRRRDEPL